jgi:hypothetical protein
MDVAYLLVPSTVRTVGYRLDALTSKSNGHATATEGIHMKKLRRAEFLLAVAIVTSAAVMQVREYMLNAAPHDTVQARSCDAPHQGLAPAACTAMRGERPAEGATHPQQSVPRIWV